ncbi:hypothetical protein apy_07900 [Aeropyrum pernix]|uniref:Nucleoside phosphorylase domain-containing protein n=1 Tax=Aeropyrum pernix TaxID=56636 RepID=A0A401H9D3_AERPX|nr:hypothetical protein apy_07900 [Aeropyrum pernix]
MSDGEETYIVIVSGRKNSISEGFSSFGSNEKSIIDPYELKKDKILHNKGIVLAFAPRLFTKLKRELGYVKPIKLSGWLFKSYEGVYHGKEVVITLPFPGSPAAVAALEVLTAMGGEVFVVVGYVGAISPALKIGDVLIPTWGVREEGTSFHYIPTNSYVPKPDNKLVETLYTHAIELKGRRRIKVVKGGIWTTDVIFRETLDKVIKYSSKGIYGVDMESTALMTVADCRNVKLGVIAAVSDELHHDGRWIRGFSTQRLRRTENLVAKAALNTVADFI